MTLYSRSDLAAVTVSVDAHGGCGRTHSRPVSGDRPVALWELSCPPCEDHLRSDPHWSTTRSEIPETHDEKLKREDFEKRGALDERKLMAMAMAKMMGIEIPDTIAGALAGQMQHIPGVMECANGHGNPAGQKFCGACGAPMSSLAAKAALPGPERPAEPPAAESFPSQEGKAVRLQDLRLDELQAACRAAGLPDAGVRKELMKRLRTAGVSNADLSRLLVAA